MNPENFARKIIKLKLPLTEEEWEGLLNIFEAIQPGITLRLTWPEEEKEDKGMTND